MRRLLDPDMDPVLKPGLPAARRKDLVAHEVDDELVIYDMERDHLHQMNRVAAAVWQLCDGRRSLQTLTLMAGATIDQPLEERSVRLALTKLEGAGLLESSLPEEIRLGGMDRRRFLKRTAIGAGALPVIVSMSAPTAAAAASSCLKRGSQCSSDSQCCSPYRCAKDNSAWIWGNCDW